MAKLCKEAVEWYRLKQTGRIDARLAPKLSEFRIKIRSLYNFFAEIAHWDLRAENVTIDPEQAGYLIFPVAEGKAFIPFFLIELVPRGETLKLLAEIGSAVRISPGSIICISGSSCQSGIVPYVADLDFCEYIPTLAPEANSTQHRLRQWAYANNTTILLYRIKCGSSGSWLAPWSDSVLATEPQAQASFEETFFKGEHRQCMFIGDIGQLGVIEITNMLVPLDYSAPEASTSANKSFASQEVPISDSGWSPRDLSDPIHLGRYLTWLVNDARSHLSIAMEANGHPRKTVKAARRLLSATRVAMMGPEVDALLTMLRRNGASLAALYDRCELYNKLQGIQDERITAYLPKLQQTINMLRNATGIVHSGDNSNSFTSLTERENEEFKQFAKIAIPEIARIENNVRTNLGVSES